MDLSLSSKHLLFLSLQRHHNKQWGTINHIYTFRLFYLSFFSQQISLENFAQHQFWHQARCSTSAWVFSMPNKKQSGKEKITKPKQKFSMIKKKMCVPSEFKFGENSIFSIILARFADYISLSSLSSLLALQSIALHNKHMDQ